MTKEDLIKCGAYLTKESEKAHFLLSAGGHSDGYVQCAKLLQTFKGKQLILNSLLRKELTFKKPNVVIGGAYGGIRFASLLAWELGENIRGIWCERVPEIDLDISKAIPITNHPESDPAFHKDNIKIKSGKFQLRRGFEIKKGEKVLIAEDVTTTGKSIGEVAELVKEHGGKIVGAISIIDRRKVEEKVISWEDCLITKVDLDKGMTTRIKPFISLIQLVINTWKPDECPLCKKNCDTCIHKGEDKKYENGCSYECHGSSCWELKYPLIKPGSKE